MATPLERLHILSFLGSGASGLPSNNIPSRDVYLVILKDGNEVTQKAERRTELRKMFPASHDIFQMKDSYPVLEYATKRHPELVETIQSEEQLLTKSGIRDRLRNTFRAGWPGRSLPKETENDDQHRQHVGWLTIILGPLAGLSGDHLRRAYTLGVHHDDPEGEEQVGDVTPFNKPIILTTDHWHKRTPQEYAAKRKKEKDGLNRLLDRLKIPHREKRHIFNAWLEFDQLKTTRAIVVRQIDILSAVIIASHLVRTGKMQVEFLNAFQQQIDGEMSDEYFFKDLASLAIEYVREKIAR